MLIFFKYYLKIAVSNEMKKLPLVRALNKVGEKRTVVIPKSWLEYAEKQKHKKIIAVAMEVNGKITIEPIFEEVKT